jgi:hypothetical protein
MFKATTLTNSLRSTTTTFAPSLTRSFHASSPTMAIKTYFDVQWTGPKVNANGSVADNAVTGKSHPAMLFDGDSTVHHGHQCHRDS